MILGPTFQRPAPRSRRGAALRSRGRRQITRQPAVRSVAQMAYYDPQLGFSLRPSKKIRKAFTAVKKAVTIKNVAKVAAIGAGIALIPGAAPLLAKTALGVDKVIAKPVVGAARLASKAVGSVLHPAGPAPGASPSVPEQVASVALETAAALAPEVVSAPVASATAATPLPAPISYATAGPAGPADVAMEESPAPRSQAAIGGPALLGMAAVVALAVFARGPRRRR